MADYAKKKNDELIALCKERGLAHSGKKADLVKRLEDHDAQDSSAAPATSGGSKPPIEDEIDWDEEPATETAKAASTAADANAIAAGGIGEVKNPVDVPNQEAAIDPAKTDDLIVAAAPDADSAAPAAEAQPVEEKAPEKDFSSGIAERTVQEEIEKRKARARKFGLPEDSDEIKSLERALRFGTENVGSVPGLLNKSLSDAPKERKRGREGGVENGDRKRSRARGKPGQGQGPRSAGDRPAGNASAPKANGPGSWMTDKDREAAEQRKARFATTT